jgi:hypothetical protein
MIQYFNNKPIEFFTQTPQSSTQINSENRSDFNPKTFGTVLASQGSKKNLNISKTTQIPQSPMVTQIPQIYSPIMTTQKPTYIKPEPKKSNRYFMHDRQYAHVGSDIEDNNYIKEYFSKNTVDLISEEITKQLKGVEKYGRDIVVPDDKIFWVMNTVYESYNYPQGFDAHFQWSGYIKDMIDQTIERIVYDVVNVLGLEYCTNDYTAWTMLLGDFNERGLRSHAPIKIRNKHPNHMEFFERY